MTEAIYIAVRSVLEKEIETTFEATVVKYDSSTRQANIQGVILLPDENQEATIEVNIYDVPVCFPGGPKFTIYGDITGATVTVIIPKVDPSNYIFGKGKDSEGEPLFSINGAICTPLAVDEDGEWSAIPQNEAGIRVDTGEALMLGDKENTINVVDALIQIIDLLNGTVSPGGLAYAGQLTLIQADLTVLKNKLTPLKPA